VSIPWQGNWGVEPLRELLREVKRDNWSKKTPVPAISQSILCSWGIMPDNIYQ
jgi:hypothetical protein